MSRLVVRNLGRVVTGELARPVVDADTLAVAGDRIEAVGTEAAVGLRADDVVIDARGGIAVPGLIDSHAHPVCGDYQPRLRVLDHVSAALECGTTSFVSAGETHYPGIPRDAQGPVATLVRMIFAEPDHASAMSKLNEVVRALQTRFREAARQWQQALGRANGLEGVELNGAIASIVHLAYHFGAIRQIDRSIRGPSADEVAS